MNLIFTTNQTAQVRRETHQGREYIVAPVVAIRQGVLNGEFVPADEIAASVFAWDDRPVTLGHPKLDGAFISARGTDTMQQYTVGRFYNVHMSDDGGKLKGEIWLDVALAQMTNEGRAVLDKLLKGDPLEVSTAYVREPSQESGTYNGREYQSVARGLVPDHLALLPHDVGACSWADGCGAPRVNQRSNSMEVNILSEARRPTFEGTTILAWERPTLGDYGLGDSIADLSEADRQRIAGGSLLGDPDGETFNDLSFFPVVTPSGELSRAALVAVVGGRGAQADIPEAAKASAQAMARGLLEEEFGMEEQTANKALSLLDKLRALFTGEGHMPQGDGGDTEEPPQHTDNAIEEVIQSLLDSGVFEGLTAEMLEGAPEALVNVLMRHAESMGRESDEEATMDENQPVTNVTAPCANEQELQRWRDLGDIDVVAAKLTELQEIKANERQDALDALVERSGVDAATLEGLSVQQLRALADSYPEKRSDFTGNAAPRPQQTDVVYVEGV